MKKISVCLFISAICSQPALAQQSEFDLICKGVQKEGLYKPKETEFVERLRISLKSQNWCKSTCYYVNPIRQVSPDRLLLDDAQKGSTSNVEEVDRRTGVYTQSLMSGIAGMSVRRGANCELAPFSGFPKRRF